MIPKRKNLRLPDFDYSQTGAYFVTICTKGRISWLGRIEDGFLRVNNSGQIVQETWEELPFRFPGSIMDTAVVMPNHFHGIVFLEKCDEGLMNQAPTLGKIVRTLKAVSTRLIRRHNPNFVWQRNYYEHIIRDEDSLNKIREYITTNPLRWKLDRENPQAQGQDEFDGWLFSFTSRPKSVVV